MQAPDRVLLDTAALYALISSSDEFHERADQEFRLLLAGDTALFVTSYVLVEFGALVHHRLGFSAIERFVESTRGVYETIWIDATIHAQAWLEFQRRRGSGLNFVDWTTLLAARTIGASIFTFDSGFARESALVLP